MNLELVIRYLGYGERCSSCGRVRETTRYTIRQKQELLQQFLLCDTCQDKGYVIKFTMRSKHAMTDKVRRRRVKLSRKLEEGLAEDVGGHRLPGSGNQDTKSDVRVVDEWRLEHKYTESTKGFRVTTDDLAAVTRHANLAGERPALVVTFSKLSKRFAVIPFEIFLELVEKLRGKTR